MEKGNNRKPIIRQKGQMEGDIEGAQRAKEGSLKEQADRRKLGQADMGPSPGPQELSSPSAMPIWE